MKALVAPLVALAVVLASPVVTAAPAVTVLLHHPNDGVDPFGFPFADDADYFRMQYGPLVADKGRFDYPYFVADGLLPIEKIPDPARPYESARSAYASAAANRLAERPPASLLLDSAVSGRTLVVAVGLTPVERIEGEDLRLRLAVVEDPVHYQPPPGLTNGVTEHRFTVRAVAEVGLVSLASVSNHTYSFQLTDGWDLSRLHVAAWLQQGQASPRFDAREVVQATSAPVSTSVRQETKGVLLEMLSATWCAPCLYGDLAIEAVAIEHGAARPLDVESGPRYLVAPRQPVASIALSALAALAVAWWGLRR